MSRSDPPYPAISGPDCDAAAGRAGSAVEAQLLGQPGARRGLREGAPALVRARNAYLSAEWRGADDRRPEPGLLVRGRL